MTGNIMFKTSYGLYVIQKVNMRDLSNNPLLPQQQLDILSYPE